MDAGHTKVGLYYFLQRHEFVNRDVRRCKRSEGGSDHSPDAASDVRGVRLVLERTDVRLVVERRTDQPPASPRRAHGAPVVTRHGESLHTLAPLVLDPPRPQRVEPPPLAIREGGEFLTLTVP